MTQQPTEIYLNQIDYDTGNRKRHKAGRHLSDLKPVANTKLKFDWGFLTTDDGFRTTGRNAWANRAAVGVTDAPIEARLNPSLWGTLQFGAPDKQPGDQLGKKPATLEELLDQKIKFKNPK